VIFQFGHYSLDTETVELKAGSVVVELEPQTFLLLQFLIENRERVVSKDKIFEVVWEGRVVADSTLSFAINAVRRAVDDDGKAQAVIRTFPRRGFRFVAPVVEAQVEKVIEEAGTDDPLTPRQKTLSPSDESPDDTAATRPGAAMRWRMPAIAVAVLVIIATGGLLVWQPWEPTLMLASVENTTFPIHDKPSVAVLAFQNMSDDPSQEYFADGMAEDIITDLSKLSALFVTARNSSFQYKGRAVDVQQIGRELGVRYVVEGSVRRSGNQVRITAQLIDSETGGHVWAERYDGSLDDVFALQDKVTGQIINALRLELTPSERLAVDAHGTDISAAYDAYLRGVGLLAERKYIDTEGNAAAQATFEEAIRLDPGYAQAYAGLSWAKWLSIASINTFASKDEVFNLAEKSLALNDNALAHRTLAKKYFAPLGVYVTTNKSADLAMVELEAAKRLQPNDPDVLADLAMALSFAGRPGDAHTLIEKAMALNPSHPDWYFAASGIAYLLTDQTELAIRDLQRWSESVPSWNVPYVFLASAYGLAGQVEAAKTALDRHRHNSIGQAPAPDPGHQKVSLRHEAAMADGADRGREIFSRPRECRSI
jgi:TolB-like protein/DNA-binding winged helix-turn-helix (wHTH) protein/Tfp pilus assembly protein PilF